MVLWDLVVLTPFHSLSRLSREGPANLLSTGWQNHSSPVHKKPQASQEGTYCAWWSLIVSNAASFVLYGVCRMSQIYGQHGVQSWSTFAFSTLRGRLGLPFLACGVCVGSDDTFATMSSNDKIVVSVPVQVCICSSSLSSWLNTALKLAIIWLNQIRLTKVDS